MNLFVFMCILTKYTVQETPPPRKVMKRIYLSVLCSSFLMTVKALIQCP
jgi:hypothetical protein